jgi:polar amino acid transport system substrate-binding protein
VQDNGTGIAPEHLNRLTDPFFTTRREVGGTGLGLSLSSRMVKEHGGALEFVSTVGEGTTVTLSLPISEKEN